MTEPLFVDTQGLRSAGEKLRSLDLPEPPPSIAVPGTNPVAAALNETVPVIELPVHDGLRTVAASLSATAEKFVTAATTYAESDRRLGEKLAQHAFGSTAATVRDGSEQATTLASAARITSAATELAADTPAAVGGAEILSGLAMAPQLGQMATVAGTAGSAVQSIVQSVQGAVTTVPATAAAPDEDREKDGDEDGAAAGEQSTEAVPLAATVDATAAATTAESTL